MFTTQFTCFTTSLKKNSLGIFCAGVLPPWIIQGGSTRTPTAIMQFDLSEHERVKTLVTVFQIKFSVLDYLINNAGIMATDCKRNSKGLELQIVTKSLYA